MDAVPPDPPLTDGVVSLRPWSEADVAAIVAACGEDEIARWLDMIPQPYTGQDARIYIASTEEGWRDGSAQSFAVTDAETGDVLGSIAVRWIDRPHGVADVGYWAKAEARGRGVTTRAVRIVTRWAIEHAGAERVQLRADTQNLASCRVAEKAGFTREGVLRSARYNPRQDRRHDWAMYSLLPGELR